jgi:hypothetical protein
MRANIIRNGASVVLWLGISVCYSVSAQAIPNNPKMCSPGYDTTSQANSCKSVPGAQVICTNDGDAMCCTLNLDGGYNCNQINVASSSGVRVPGAKLQFDKLQSGKLQVLPGTISPNTSKIPQAGKTTTQTLQYRGVEGAPATSAPAGEEDKDKVPAPK